MNSGKEYTRVTQSAAGMFTESKFLEELDAAAQSQSRKPEQALRYARKCLKEIEATPSDAWLAPAARIARFIYTRSYEPKLDINTDVLEQLRENPGNKLRIFLWSHKSHMDSFLFLLSLYDKGFKPLPLVFAGANMNFLGFGALARRVGAIFLRRSFQKDPVYKLVFKHYIDHLIRNRLPLTWSIEGTRSRTGKLSPPKLGILNWVLEACERENMQDVELVPVSIAFDRIAEIDDYVSLQQGMPKRKESLGWFLNFIFGMKEPYGKIYVRYAEPVALTDISQYEQIGTGDSSTSLAMRLAFEVCTRIERITPIKAADVLTMVLLATDGRALSHAEIFRQATDISCVVKQRGLPVATGFSLESKDQVAAAVLSMRSSGLVQAFDKGSTPVFFIPAHQQLAAAYYRNTITHYFLASAFGELALALGVNDITLTDADILNGQVDRLRDLFKFEFFFEPKDILKKEVQEETTRRYPDWSGPGASVHKQLRKQPPQFAHAILRSIIEAYYVVAHTLLSLETRSAPEPKKFTHSLLQEGREMLLRRRISGESAISKDLFSTGLRLAQHRELLSGNGQELLSRRQSFAVEIRQILAAINMLQACYDKAWFDSTNPTTYTATGGDDK